MREGTSIRLDVEVAVLAIGRRIEKQSYIEKKNENRRWGTLGKYYINLSKTCLKKVNLRGVNLSYVNLNGAVLDTTDFTGAFLCGADMSGANLSYARLIGAGLDFTDFSGADLKRAEFVGNTFRGAEFNSTNLTSANLLGVNLFAPFGLAQEQLDKEVQHPDGEPPILPSDLEWDEVAAKKNGILSIGP